VIFLSFFEGEGITQEALDSLKIGKSKNESIATIYKILKQAHDDIPCDVAGEKKRMVS